jgi:hypothetical protein
MRLRLATDGLADLDPVLSTRPRSGRHPGRWAVLATGVVLIVALARAPQATGVVVAGALVLLYAAATVHRLLLIRRAVTDDPTVQVSDDEARAVPDDALPVYTVLVPAYQEPEVGLDRPPATVAAR